MIHPAKKPMEGGFSMEKFLSGVSKEDAEALGEMFDAMEAEKSLNGWVPCSKQLPKPYSEALVTGTKLGRIKPRTYTLIATYCVHKPGYHDDETGWWLVDDMELMDPQPTHWMPLPEPPK